MLVMLGCTFCQDVKAKKSENTKDKTKYIFWWGRIHSKRDLNVCVNIDCTIKDCLEDWTK